MVNANLKQQSQNGGKYSCQTCSRLTSHKFLKQMQPKIGASLISSGFYNIQAWCDVSHIATKLRSKIWHICWLGLLPTSLKGNNVMQITREFRIHLENFYKWNMCCPSKLAFMESMHWVSDAPPSSLCDPKKVQRVGFAELDRNLVPLPASSTKRGREVVLEAPGLD
jgi:hypothetical protein